MLHFLPVFSSAGTLDGSPLLYTARARRLSFLAAALRATMSDFTISLSRR